MSAADLDTEAIKASQEKWEQENGPEGRWVQTNIDKITQHYSGKCAAIIEVGFNNTVNAQARAFDMVSLVTTANGWTQAEVDDFKQWDEGANYGGPERWISFGHNPSNFNGCRASVEGFGPNKPASEILSYEYELARAQAVFDEVVAPQAQAELSDEAGNLVNCAIDLQRYAVQAQEYVNVFWEEAKTKLFNGSYPESLRDAIPSIPSPVERLQAGQKSGAILPASGSSVPQHAKVKARGGSVANGYYDHILLETLGGDQTLKLAENVKVVDDPSLSVLDILSGKASYQTRPASTSSPLIVDNSNMASFPFYYASFLVTYINQVSRISRTIIARLGTDTNSDFMKNLSNNSPGAYSAVTQMNHADNLTGVWHAQNNPTKAVRYVTFAPHGLFETFDAYSMAMNSNEATRYFSLMSGEAQSGGAGGVNYTVKGFGNKARLAANLLTTFYEGNDEATIAQNWILETITQFEGIVELLHSKSKCIHENDKSIDNQLDDLTEAFSEALEDSGYYGSGLFKDNSLNAAVHADPDFGAETVFGGLGQTVTYREQCFLLSYVNRIAGYKKHRLELIQGSKSKCTKRIPYTKHGFEIDMDQALGVEHNACIQIDGDPYGFINKLTQNPNYDKFFQIDNWHLSGLQPKIRLFKVIYDDDNNEKEIELSFESHFSTNEMDFFMERKSRGAGVGIKSFDFTYDGSNPFAVKKSIKANLKIFATSFSELFESRFGVVYQAESSNNSLNVVPKGYEEYRYADLAMKTTFKQKDAEERAKISQYDRIMNENVDLAKLNFRLKAVVGWSEPRGGLPSSTFSNYDTEEIKKAAAESFVTLNLTPTVHNFDFDEQGRVIFEINYLAYIEDFFDQRAYNAFADPTGKMGVDREIRRLRMKKHSKECSKSNEEAVQNLKKEFSEIAATEKRKAVKNIVLSLMENKKVFYLNISNDILKEFVSFGPYAPNDALLVGGDQLVLSSDDHDEHVTREIENALAPAGEGGGGYGAGATDDEIKHLRAALRGLNPEKTYLPFFYISDLLDIVLVNIEKELDSIHEKLPQQLVDNPELDVNQDELNQRVSEIKRYQRNFKKLRIMLGPVELRQDGPKEKFKSIKKLGHGISATEDARTGFVNFGDLPVAVSFFVEFLAETTLRNEDSYYSLTRMINDLFNKLVDKFLNEQSCFAFDISQKVRVNQNMLTSYSPYTISADHPRDEITHYLKMKLGDWMEAGKPESEWNFSPARLNLSDPILSRLVYQKNRPILNISGQANEEHSTYAPLSHEMNYFVFYAARTRPVNRMNGVEEEDSQSGIFHYLLGRNKGIVKNIKLTKTSTPGLQEVRFEQEGYDGLEQLRVVYDVEIDCYANVNAFPGTYLYIPPKGFDPAVDFDMTKFGVGGYYMIYRSSHSFAAGQASTKIYAKWVAQLETEAEIESRRTTDADSRKCGLSRRQSAEDGLVER